MTDKQTREAMMKLYRKLILRAFQNEFISLTIQTSFKSNSLDSDFLITAFDNRGDNVTLYFYNFHTLERLEQNLLIVLKALKLDSLDEIKKAEKLITGG